TQTSRPRPRNDVAPSMREMPHSPELEKSILAVLLDGRHATAIHTVRAHAPHSLCFFNRDHRLIYQACLDIDDQGHRIDAAGVAEILRKTGFQVALDRLRQQQMLSDADQLDGMSPAQRRALYRWRDADAAAEFQDSTLAAVGGYPALADIAAAYTSAAGLDRNGQLLADYHHKRKLIQCLTRISDNAYRTTQAFSEILDGASQNILNLSRMSEATNQVHAMADAVHETIESIIEHNANPETGVLTGYDEVDELLMSLRPGGLYILAARPGVGKTSFALSIVQHVCGDSPHPNGALFFSLEVDRVDLVKKLLCGKANVPFKDMERGMLEGPAFDDLERCAEEIKRWKLDLMDVSDLTVQGLRSVVKRHMLERGGDLKLIVIDYLQLLSASRADMNEYEKISEISRTLKILAKEMRLPIVALSQMSRESEKAAGKPREPRLSDLRGSGSIEQDADAVLFLHKVSGEDDANTASEGRDVKLIVAKNRFGPTGHQNMKFFPARQRFKPVPKEQFAGGGGVPTEVGTRAERMDQSPGDDEDLFA
nr:AAA family ATPase [Planctomycetota bacterium]